MRIIKFKGKRETDGEWIYGDFFRNRGLSFIAADGLVENPLANWRDYNVRPETVCQFTGLVDACGNEIYDGDLLSEVDTDKVVEVLYCAPEFCFKPNEHGYVFLNHPENFEVIGNIFDNQHLRKGE